MRGIRRAALALGVGAVFALLIKLRGSAPNPVGAGGWRELDENDLRCARPGDSAQRPPQL